MNAAANGARYFAVFIAAMISAIPTFIMLPMLGSVNFVPLAAIWLFLLWRYKGRNKAAPWHWMMLGAVLMAIPPTPNYVAISDSGRMHLNFIGFANVFDHPFGIVFFFVFYMAIFYLAFKLYPKNPAIKGGGG